MMLGGQEDEGDGGGSRRGRGSGNIGGSGGSVATSSWPHQHGPWWEVSSLSISNGESQPPASDGPAQQQQQQQQRGRRCAINLYGLPRAFRHHVLPSLRRNVIAPNLHYRCDYYVHFFNKTSEEGGRSGGGGTIVPHDVYLLREAVLQEQQQQQHQDRGRAGTEQDHSSSDDVIVQFVADTDNDFEVERRDAIDQIVHNSGGTDGAGNPYLIRKMGKSTLLNVLKMWHSQTKVWDLMERSAAAAVAQQQQRQQRNGDGLPVDDDSEVLAPYYERVAMLRLDVIYMTPIDIYRFPDNPFPRDTAVTTAPLLPDHELEYYWDNGTSAVMTGTFTNGSANNSTNAMRIRRHKENKNSNIHSNNNNNNNVVIPLFASYPVNDRFIAGPYHAVKLWATGRWSRAHQHVHTVLPKYNMQKFGLHDERFVALTLIPEMQRMGGGGGGGGESWGKYNVQSPFGRNSNGSNSTKDESNKDNKTSSSSSASLQTEGPKINVHADPAIYFLRVRANGAIWIRDSPNPNTELEDKDRLEAILGRPCTVPFVVKNLVSAGRWQILCPVAEE
jgi:hypothetical protein